MTSRVIATFVAAFALSVSSALASPAFTVETILGEWTDNARADRVVPYKIYMPREAQGARPIVIFSHGLGGNRDGAVYLLDHLASHGYVAVAVQHHGSDTQAVMGELGEGGFANADPATLRERLKQSTSPAVAIDRFRDIPFTITSLETMNATDSKLRGRLDLNRIGMSGHSFGAITTMALAGQNIGGRPLLIRRPAHQSSHCLQPVKTTPRRHRCV